jgi:hypothetical protein
MRQTWTPTALPASAHGQEGTIELSRERRRGLRTLPGGLELGDLVLEVLVLFAAVPGHVGCETKRACCETRTLSHAKEQAAAQRGHLQTRWSGRPSNKKRPRTAARLSKHAAKRATAKSRFSHCRPTSVAQLAAWSVQCGQMTMWVSRCGQGGTRDLEGAIPSAQMHIETHLHQQHCTNDGHSPRAAHQIVAFEENLASKFFRPSPLILHHF